MWERDGRGNEKTIGVRGKGERKQKWERERERKKQKFQTSLCSEEIKKDGLNDYKEVKLSVSFNDYLCRGFSSGRLIRV